MASARACLDLLDELQQRVRPAYHVFVHIHEGWGAQTDGTTTYLNASTCTLKYRPDNPALIFDLPARETAEEAAEAAAEAEATSEAAMHEFMKERKPKEAEAKAEGSPDDEETATVLAEAAVERAQHRRVEEMTGGECGKVRWDGSRVTTDK